MTAHTNQEFQKAHALVLALIDRFEKHADRYVQPSYQEAETRKDFIDPLLKAMGWDVDHEREHNPYEQEVKVESGLIVHDARSQKRADYAFYLAPNFRDVRFYVEAKKPSVDLARSTDAHFQTLRYGYSAGTPLAVLTDFEQIRVLDCRRRPHPDSALDQTYKHWRYTDFRDQAKFAEFYWLFSREAHADGSYQRRIDDLPKARGGAKQRGLFKGGYQSVDASFLEDLAEFREALAKAYKKADHALGSAELTELVQRTLDRLVFLRFLEDKQIETEIRVSDFGKRKDAWADFQEASKRLDNIYNGIVFKPLPHLDDTTFALDGDVFGDICERLAAENSPYNFDAIPIHILGSIYERFLGSVIRATDKRAVVEEKPEVRKAGGVYYTPEYIVRYIVSQTVGKLIEGKTPQEISKLHFADIACGSGSFLLGIYDELLRYHTDWYNLPGREKQAKKDGCVQTEDGRWRLSLAQRRNILQSNVYGVDLDRQAVEVAQLSLFLKLLEDERATSARQYQLEYARDAHMKRLLPDLSGNVVCGNSLIGFDTKGVMGMNQAHQEILNPLDLHHVFPHVMRADGFDAIVGNPPYVRIQTLNEFNPLAAQLLKETYASAAKGNFDVYVIFIERALQALKKEGKLGYIVPHKFFNAKYGAPLRALIAKNQYIEAIVHFGSGQVFAGATTYTCLLFLARSPRAEFKYESVVDLTAWRERGESSIGSLSVDQVKAGEWNFVVGEDAPLFRRVVEAHHQLEEFVEIFVGVQTSADDIFHMDRLGENLYFSQALGRNVEVEDELMRPIVSGVDVSRYRHPLIASKSVLFPYREADEQSQLIPFKELESRYPHGAAYLNANKEALRKREGGKFADPQWFRFGRSQNIGKQSRSKLCIPRLVNRLGLAADLEGKFVLDNVDV